MIKTILRHILTLAILASPGLCMATNPYTGTTSVFVKYANADKNADLHSSPIVYVAFNGSTDYHPFIMDTGSVGIIASPDYFKPAHDATNLGEGSQFYSSDGVTEHGTWWTATQQIYDADGTLLATAEVPVLQVTSITCSKDHRKCHATKHPKKIGVMGIGFGRETATQQRKTPGYNAFLNLQKVRQNGQMADLPSDWCKGYVVTPTGVYLGLTGTNTAGAGFVKLMPWPQYSTPSLTEWMPAPMTVSVNGIPGNGHVLMDTGVGDAFLSPPSNADVGTLVDCPGSTRQQCAPDGDVIGVYLPDQTNPVAYYNFTVGQADNPMSPVSVTVVNDATGVFLNTSRHVLGGINFIYDNTNGYIGYIWNGGSSSTIGAVIPAVTDSTTTITPSANPATVGTNVTLNINVVGVATAQIPTGTVTLVINQVPQYPITLNTSGQASYSTATLPVGVYSIVAQYSGDSTFIRSNSSTLTLTITP